MKKRILSVTFVLIVALCLLLPIHVNATAPKQAGIVSTNGSNLNIRDSASFGSSIVAKLTNGSYITLLSRSGDWWQVEYSKNRYGYCHTNYIQTLSSDTATVLTNSGNLNVRGGAGTAYNVKDQLAKGENVTILSRSSGWSHILYHGTKTGYVSSQYLSGGSVYSPITLAVPSFKQTDTRWADVTLGTSDKTMAKIGCATTAIAMMESYRTGSIITPDVMAQKLRYTPSGSVYWPSHYAVTTNASNYLNQIYSLLKMGKPVLFGAKNNTGGQHWVVITGYSGGNCLSPSGFSILDPGSSSRSNLQHFLNAYPNIYKYFHY